MKRLSVILGIFVIVVLLIGSQGQSTMARDSGDFLTEGFHPSDPPEIQTDGMPGWPMPDKPIPHHEPGHISRAGSYSTQVLQENEAGVQQVVEISGLDAMATDGLDPLAGNYTLVGLDKIMTSWNAGGQQSVQTLTPTLDIIPGSQTFFGNYPSMDIAAGDLNSDGQSEQIVAWMGAQNQIYLSTGEMPGTLGRTTSAPAAISHGTTVPDGWSLEFDGVDDYVDAGTGITLADASFTVAFWARRKAIDRYDWILGQGISSSNEGLNIGFRSNNKFVCAFFENDLETPAFTDMDWHHWACTYDADTNLRIIYRDGVIVTQDTAPADYQGSGTLTIGDSPSSYSSIWGLVDQVGVWDAARTADQIRDDMIRSTPDVTDLLAYWPFDEGDGDITADISENGHDGTLVNDPLWNPENAPQGELGEIHLLVRGYDDTLWHCNYDLDSRVCLNWDNAAGGTLLSAPAVASLGEGQFDVFAIGTDNQVYRRHWGGYWEGDWQQVGDWPHELALWSGPTPELPPVAVVARNGGFDLFRLGPDNTLRWHDGTSWQPLGGMLASAPGAVSLGADHMQVFARGVDDALWYLTYGSGNWGTWQRLAQGGMDESVTIASAPTVVSPAPNQIDAYVRGSDKQLWKLAFDGSWGTWTSFGGSLVSGVAVAEGIPFAQAQDGSLQHSDGITWTSLGGLSPCCEVFDTTLEGVLKNKADFYDYSVDVETGYFLGDGRSQIVLAYETITGTVQIALYQTVGGFLPKKIAKADIENHDVDWFRITTGDFLDGDGVDEVALGYVRKNTDNKPIYSVDIVRLSLENPGVAVEGTPETKGNTCWDGANKMKFAGTLQVASGDLDADGSDEIAMMLLLYCEHYQVSKLPECQTYDYHAQTRLYDVADSNELKTYYIEDHWEEEAERYTDVPEIVGLAIAVGDVDGDGQDDLIRTWPHEFGDRYNSCMGEWFECNDLFSRKLEVYWLPEKPWPEAGGQLYPDQIYQEDPTDYDKWSHGDRMTAGDLDRDMTAEIVWLIGKDNGRELSTYDYVGPDEWDITSESLDDLWYPKLVTGDFTGEALRVGSPSYRRQYSVGRIMAIINAPPKHIDILNGVEYNINADDPETKTELTLGEGTSTHVSLTTMRDWGLSATFSATFGDPAASHTTDSLTTSYGENFEDTTGYLTTLDIEQTREASADDALFYIRTDYDVWEYPVLADPSGTAADYISVVFPASAPRLRVERGNTCDSWYQPRHQLDNVWSYPSSVEQLTDRNEGGDGDLFVYSDYLVTEDPSSFTVNFTSVDEAKKTSGFDMGISNEFEWQIGGEEIGFEIEGVGYKTKLPSFKFSSKAEYNYSELAEWEMTTTDSTEVYGHLNGVPGGDTAGYDYAVQPYLYWTEDGYLMLDYTTSPNGTFWEKYDKPDPAFTLPWSNGQCNTAADPQTEAFTRDIHFDPPVVSAGEPVTITATVRNFSMYSNAKAFDITFYLGDPDSGGTQIGAPQTIAAYALGPRAVKTVTVHWTATGNGDQRIYAVIDPTNQLAEVHDETDPYVNNNKGYGLLRLGAVDFVDIGEAVDKVYYEIAYGLNPTMQVSLFVPVGNLAENTRFDFQDADLAVPDISGKAFELLAYRGEDNWDDPAQDYSFQPDTVHPPAVVKLSYADSDIAGMDEGSLTLYRLGTNGWEVATCPNYDVLRFPQDNQLVVPLCKASIFVLSDEQPTFIFGIYLPLVNRP